MLIRFVLGALAGVLIVGSLSYFPVASIDPLYLILPAVLVLAAGWSALIYFQNKRDQRLEETKREANVATETEVAEYTPLKSRFLKDDPNWRDKLLTSIRKNSVAKPKRTRKDATARFTVGLLLFGAVVIFMFFVIMHDAGNDTDIPGMIAAKTWAEIKIVCAVLLIFLLPAGAYAWRHFFNTGMRTLAPDVFAEFDRLPHRRPVLLLRSFTRDMPDKGWKSLTGDPFEIAVVKGLREFGPVIALGKPDEDLPPMGAARVYVNNEMWKPMVVEMLAESQLVMLFAGFTEGLLWELRTIAEFVDPSRVIMCIPPRAKRLETWQQFIALSREILPTLPDDPGTALFLQFDRSWHPTLIGDLSRLKVRGALQAAISALAIPATGENLRSDGLARKQATSHK